MKFKEFETYWANTSSNRLIGSLIQRGSPELKSVMEDCMNGNAFHTVIDEQVIFSQLDCNENAVWSLLLAAGYLKASDIRYDKNHKKEYVLDIVNFEVRRMLEEMFSGWFAVCQADYNDFIKALLANDTESLNVYMNKVTLYVLSCFDSGKKPSVRAEPERFYHGLVLGLMADLWDRYAVTSNRESGLGRYDVLLEPRNGKDDGIILEFKVFDPKKESDLYAAADAALKQILDKQYAAVLEAKGLDKGRIRIYGFVFKGLTVESLQH